MVTNIISQERLTKYLVAAGPNPDRALALYGWNIQLSEAFFPVLSAAEVSLRNIIVARLIALYGPQWWDDPAFLLQIKSGGKRIVKTARDKLVTTGAVTSGRMTAELNFGFWVKKFNVSKGVHFFGFLLECPKMGRISESAILGGLTFERITPLSADSNVGTE